MISESVARGGLVAGFLVVGLLTNIPGAAAQDVPSWRLSSPVAIGTSDDFTRITAVMPGSDGSVAVADQRNAEIRVYDKRGTYLHNLGKQGRGPGEFVRIHAAGALGDTVWVMDAGEARTTLFARDGSVLGTIPRGGPAMAALLRGGALAFGRLESPTVAQRAVTLTTRDGLVRDTVAWLPYKNATFAAGPTAEGSYTIGPQRFSDAGLLAVAPDGSRFYAVDRSQAASRTAAEFRVVAMNPAGDTVWSRAYRYVPKPFERSRADSLLAATVGRHRRHPPEMIRSAVFVPRFYPPVTQVVAGQDGSLWLRREEGAANSTYWIIGPDGALLAALNLPANVAVMAATASEVWAVHTDENDVPTVRRYSILR